MGETRTFLKQGPLCVILKKPHDEKNTYDNLEIFTGSIHYYIWTSICVSRKTDFLSSEVGQKLSIQF